jgi:hypothetical protein
MSAIGGDRDRAAQHVTGGRKHGEREQSAAFERLRRRHPDGTTIAPLSRDGPLRRARAEQATKTEWTRHATYSRTTIRSRLENRSLPPAGHRTSRVDGSFTHPDEIP